MKIFNIFKSKKPTLKELAIYLQVSYQTVKQYPKKKKILMQLGLWVLKEDKLLSKEDKSN